jgi:hypothetical protein
MVRIKGHDDEKEDKKLFSKMLKKAMPAKKISAHLKEDIKEQRFGIHKDKALMKSIKHAKG